MQFRTNLPLALLLLVFVVSCERSAPDSPFAAGDDDDTTANDDDDSTPPETDGDGDGHATPEDCDDNDHYTWPGAPELCDEKDNDCDGEVDEEPLANLAWYPDSDQDGYGTEEGLLIGCEPLDGYSTIPGDCNDDNPSIHPGALIDGYDADCDGRIEWRVTIIITVVESYSLCVDHEDNIIGSDTLWEHAETWKVWLDSGLHTIGFRGVGSDGDSGDYLTGAIIDISISNGTQWWSNNNWRYDPEPENDPSNREGWCSNNFNDDEWGIARDFGSWGVPPWGPRPVELEQTAASWIWDDAPGDHITQYFRREIELP